MSYILWFVSQRGTKIEFYIQIWAYHGDKEIAWFERGVLFQVTFLWDETFLRMEPGGFSESLVTININGLWDVTPCCLVDKHQYYV
jgi:hypothetical protein